MQLQDSIVSLATTRVISPRFVWNVAIGDHLQLLWRLRIPLPAIPFSCLLTEDFLGTKRCYFWHWLFLSIGLKQNIFAMQQQRESNCSNFPPYWGNFRRIENIKGTKSFMKIISSLCFLNHTFTIFSCILGPNMESRGRHGQLLFIPRHILDCLESSIHIIFDSGLPLPSQSKVYFFLLNTFSIVTFIFYLNIILQFFFN